MRDIDVRIAVRDRLGREHADDPTTTIVEEMGIWGGAVRIDVAVINGELCGYELKSARDTLSRLPNQAALYSEVFDRVTLVTASNHLEEALDTVPRWWGVLVATPTKTRGLHLRSRRAPRVNPAVDRLQIARLLWRSEAIEILSRGPNARGVKSASAERLAVMLSERLPLHDLRYEVRAKLKARSGWLGKQVNDLGDMPIDGDLGPALPTA